jgi:alpha-glucosidase
MIMTTIADLLRAVRFMGWRNVFRTLVYTLRRSRMERNIRGGPEFRPIRRPGPLVEAQRAARGATFQFRDATLEVHFLASDFVRLTWQPGTFLPPYAPVEEGWPDVEVFMRREGHSISLRTEHMDLRVSEDGGLIYLNGQGQRVRMEYPPEWRGDGVLHRVRLRPEERVHGMGARAAPFNLRPGRYRMWNHDPGGSYHEGDDPLYLSLPVFFTLHEQACTLVFHENSHDGEVIAEDPMEVFFQGGGLRYYVACGTAPRVLRRFTQLTGRPSLPPRWALGYHQSRWGYLDDGHVREVLEGFEKRDLPLSGLHLDIDYMDGYRVFTVDEQRFPDLHRLARKASRQGVRLVTILDPGIKRDPSYAVYQNGLAHGAFCRLADGSLSEGLVWPGWSLFPDFTDPDVRAWWGQYYESLLEKDVAGFWHDMNEPSCFTAWGDTTMHLSTQHAMEGQGGDHRQAHNLYGLLMNRAGFEALRRARPDRRPWILSRSGWVGGSRYAWNWTGDTESSWNALRITLATVLNLGLSGVAYTGPDVGGFRGSPSSELFTRWFQMAAFMPFFRTHSARGTPRREPWSFGKPTLKVLRRFLQLRYRLLPYLYTLAKQTSEDGLPQVRPLFWLNEQDRRLWDVDDAFLLGDALLVAPVLEPDVRERQVDLPEGTWYDLWDGVRLAGPGPVKRPAPLERMPVLVREGTILPMEQQEDTLCLDVYPTQGGRAHGEVFSDAGDGYGEGRLDRFSWNHQGGQATLLRESEGGYPLPYTNFEIQVHGVELRDPHVDGRPATLAGNRLTCGPFQKVQFQVRSD